MAHGYLGEGYGTHGEIDPDRGDQRNREWRERDRTRGQMFGGWDRNDDEYSRGSRDISANPDDHYRSWRDRHMSELDRDYEEYCMEREQQFHRDFDQWRRERHGVQQPLRTGMTQSGLSADPTGMTQAAEDSAPATPEEADPMATATLGANSRSRSRR